MDLTSNHPVCVTHVPAPGVTHVPALHTTDREQSHRSLPTSTYAKERNGIEPIELPAAENLNPMGASTVFQQRPKMSDSSIEGN